MEKLSDYVLNALADAGARDVFFVPGGAAMHLNDSLGKNARLSFVSTFHENAAATAAEAYSKLKNNLGVAMVTGGPGSTNALTGLTSAWVNSAPLVVLSGQVKLADLNTGLLRQSGLQEVDIEKIVQPVTKYAVTVRDPADIRFHLEKAIYLAKSGRPGPVWLDIPMDIQGTMIEPSDLKSFDPSNQGASDALSEEIIATIVRRWKSSKRPVILAGVGVRLAGGEARLLELVERAGTPVQLTWIGVDLVPSDHPLYAGRPGAFAGRAANFAIQNADFVLCLGARLDFATTGFSRERFARGAYKVVVDCDAAEIAKLGRNVDLGLVADAAQFADKLLAQFPTEERPDFGNWVSKIRDWEALYPIVTEEMRSLEHKVSTYALIEKLSELLEPGDVIVEGSAGVHSEIFFMTFDVKAGQRILADGSFGSMGYGLPAAIGACVANSRRRTILVDGDGSLQPQLQELETIKRENLPIKIIVVNNGGYSSIRVSQSRYFDRLVGADETSGLSLPSFLKLAEAYGIPYCQFNDYASLGSGLSLALASDGPTICEIFVPEEEDRVPRLANLQREDGSMVSKPLEDMFPFLPREEFLENMIISPIPED